jgi:hypothetical protein
MVIREIIAKHPNLPSYVGMTAEELIEFIAKNRRVGRAMADVQRDLMRIAWLRGKKILFVSDKCVS